MSQADRSASPATAGEGAGPSKRESEVEDLARKWLCAAETEAVEDDLKKLVEETKMPLEKLAGKEGLRMGPYQLVLWQPRYVFADLTGLHYQKLSTQNRPMGKPKKITFASILEVTELEQGEIVIRCRQRDYTFKAPDASKASVMVHNLRQLIVRHAEASGETGEQEGADS
mmetsp:Transcript_1198/g.3676  ORF Transcript_1198/g.3676 Transcript_1198/m.3676 type:complete len:171 (+) Transcript_1198:85-597(+)